MHLGRDLRRGRYGADHWNARLAQHVLDNRFAQAGCVVIKVEIIRFFVEAEALQTVRIREPPKRAVLLSGQRLLQLVRYGHECHSGRLYHRAGLQRLACRSRSAFVITDTELKVIAALAKIGLSSNPKNG